MNFTAEQEHLPYSSRLVPRDGLRSGGTVIHIYGKYFEQAICKESQLRCSFEGVATSVATYVSNEHIMCVTPDLGLTFGQVETYNVSVQLNGVNWLSSNLSHTYKYEVPENTGPPTTNGGTTTDGSTSGATHVISLNQWLISFILFSALTMNVLSKY